MAINSLFVIAGVFVLRRKNGTSEGNFSIPLYPLPPIIFIAITLVTLGYLTIQNTEEILFSAGTIITGGLGYWLTIKFSNQK